MPKEFAIKPFALSKVYQLLEPGPVVLLTTVRRGIANVMALFWHMMVEFEPPQLACVVSNANYSFRGLRAARECVIAIPASHLAPVMVKVGNSSGRDIDKFAAFGLIKIPSTSIRPPLIGECFASLECKVIDTRFVNKYNIFILEVVKALDQSSTQESQDPSPPRVRQIRHRWTEHQVEIANAVM